MQMRNVTAFLPSRIARWTWLGYCPLCGTSVLLDDEFVRVEGHAIHAECERYRRTQRRPLR